MADMTRPQPPPEAILIEESRGQVFPRLSMREAAKHSGISDTRWRQIVAGYQQVGPDAHITVRAPADTLARMAAAVGVQPHELERVGREDAARQLRKLLAQAIPSIYGDYASDDVDAPTDLTEELSGYSTSALASEVARRAAEWERVTYPVRTRGQEDVQEAPEPEQDPGSSPTDGTAGKGGSRRAPITPAPKSAAGGRSDVANAAAELLRLNAQGGEQQYQADNYPADLDLPVAADGDRAEADRQDRRRRRKSEDAE